MLATWSSVNTTKHTHATEYAECCQCKRREDAGCESLLSTETEGDQGGACGVVVDGEAAGRPEGDIVPFSPGSLVPRQWNQIYVDRQ